MTGWDLAGGLEDLHHLNYGEDMSWMTEGFGCRRKRAKETELFSREGKRGRRNVKERGRGGGRGGGGREGNGRESWEEEGSLEDERKWEDERGWEQGTGWRRPERHGRMDMGLAYEREGYDRRDRRGRDWREDYDEGDASYQHGFSTSWPPAEEEVQQPETGKEKWQQDDWMTADIGWDNLGVIERSDDGMGSGTGRGAGRGAGSSRHDDQRSADYSRGRGRVRHDDAHGDGRAPGNGRGGRGRHNEEYRGRGEEFRGKRNDVPKHYDKPYSRDGWDGSRDPKMDWSRGPEKGRGKDDGPNKGFYKGKGPVGDQSRNQDHGRIRDRDYERNKDRKWDSDHRRERDRDRDSYRSQARDRDGPSSHSRERSYERGGEKERGDRRDGSRKKSIEGKDGSAKEGKKLEWYEEEMPLTVEEKEAMYTCTLCNVKCGGAKNYKQHLNGVTHRMRAQVFPDEDPARYLEPEEPEEEYQEEEYWGEEEELTLEERMKLFYCHLCDVQNTSKENLKMHTDGMRHKANIERQKKGEDVVKGSRNKGSRGRKKKITLTGEEVTEIQPIIDSCSEPLVGLEMIIEYLRQEWQAESIFYCTLCEARFQQVNFMPHVTGYRHRYAYIKIKRPDAKDMCRVEPKEKETFKEVDGKKVKEIIPKRNRTAVLANLKKVCYEIQKEQGRQKMLKGPDPDPPEMPLNRLKKTMKADSQVKLKALDPEEFSEPVSNPPPIPIGGVKRPAPKSKPKERVEERPTIIGYKPPDVPPPGMAQVPSDLPPGAPPPTAMMMRPGARPGMPPVKARPLPPPPRPPPRRPDATPQIGLPPKSWKMRELEEEMEKDLEIARSMMQERDRREDSSYMLEALEREKEKMLHEARSLDIEMLKDRDRARLRERDPFLASYIEKGHAPKPEGGQERGLVYDQEKDKASTSRSKSDEELKREYEERFGKKESSSSSSRVLAEVVGALSKSLAQSDEDASMALKVSSALTKALLSIKKKEQDSRTAVDFPNVESEGPPPPPPGDAETPLLPSESPPTQQSYTIPPFNSYQQAQPVPQQAPLQQVPQPASQPLGEWQPVNPPQSISQGYPTPHPVQPQYHQPGYPNTIPSAAAQPGWVPQPQPPIAQVQGWVPSYMQGVPAASAPHQYMPPYTRPEPPEIITSEPAPPAESKPQIFSF